MLVTNLAHANGNDYLSQRFAKAYAFLAQDDLDVLPLGRNEIDGDDAVIGFFDDESFMIVNKNYQDGAEYERKYTLKDHRGGPEYFDTDTGEWRSADGASFMSYDENGCCVLTIAPAAALLLRVKK